MFSYNQKTVNDSLVPCMCSINYGYRVGECLRKQRPIAANLLR